MHPSQVQQIQLLLQASQLHEQHEIFPAFLDQRPACGDAQLFQRLPSVLIQPVQRQTQLKCGHSLVSLLQSQLNELFPQQFLFRAFCDLFLFLHSLRDLSPSAQLLQLTQLKCLASLLACGLFFCTWPACVSQLLPLLSPPHRFLLSKEPQQLCLNRHNGSKFLLKFYLPLCYCQLKQL